MAQVFATADIGSNTVHLLVGKVAGGVVNRLENETEWLSLGEIVSREGEVPPALEERLIEVLNDYKKIASKAGAEDLYIFATEAMRRAENHEAVLKKLKKEVGIEVDLIPPEREAELSLRGTLIDSHGLTPLLMVEVGGGSAQVAFYHEDEIYSEFSLPLGTGVLLQQAGLTQPVTAEQLDRLERLIEQSLEKIDSFSGIRRVVASGGVARGIWRALHPDGMRQISIEELKYLAWSTERLTVEQIISRFGCRPKRASTFLPGARVYLALLEAFEQYEMVVSEFGVREGALIELAEGKLEPVKK
jgi:exopolyphosphatase/guanosine-5'-triphosphate,3'-diphosphate pyrophosphatase